MSFFIQDVQDCSAAEIRGAKFRERPTFSQLPDEILEDTLLEDVLDHKDLCALALVSRRVGRLMQASLYSQVEISLSGKKYETFVRTILKHPELGSYVWKAHLTRKIYNPRIYLDMVYAEEEIYRRAKQLLEMLPALRVLEMGRFKCSDEFTSLLNIPMPHLRFISFCNDARSSSIHEVREAVSLPQVNRIEIRIEETQGMRVRGTQAMSYEAISWKQHCTALETLAGTSSVKDLTLNGWFDSVVLGSCLWKVPHALEKLTCVFQCTGHLTPEETINALRPLYSTLVLLDLSYLNYLDDPSGPVGDFSCFVCLKSLAVDDSLCFELSSSEAPDERCGFYNRLPSTLETLQVSVIDVIW
jgi:hypothetical protein